jgi:hypothetical protein
MSEVRHAGDGGLCGGCDVSRPLSHEEARTYIERFRPHVLDALTRPRACPDLKPEECQLFREEAYRSEEWMMRALAGRIKGKDGKAPPAETVGEIGHTCFNRLIDALTTAMVFGKKWSAPDPMNGWYLHCQEKLPLTDDFRLPPGKRVRLDVLRYVNICGELDLFHGGCFGWQVTLECRWELEDTA